MNFYLSLEHKHQSILRLELRLKLAISPLFPTRPLSAEMYQEQRLWNLLTESSDNWRPEDLDIIWQDGNVSGMVT